MKKFFFFIPVLFLILATTITKNSTKKLDKEIFVLKENLRALEDLHELVLLDYNVLTSPEQLVKYQKIYFEDELIQEKIENINRIKINDYLIEIEKIEINNE